LQNAGHLDPGSDIAVFQKSSGRLPIGTTNFHEKISCPIDPSPLTRLERSDLVVAFKAFSVDSPQWSCDPKMRHAQLLKATYEYYAAFNSDSLLTDISWEACVRSIYEPEFIEPYSKIYKYCRQAYYGDNWIQPEDFPIELNCLKQSSWNYLVPLLKRTTPATPEVLIPPELLYPYLTPEPKDIEFLEDQSIPNKLDTNLMEEIIESVLEPPRKIPTMIDFVASQTNTKKIHTASTERELSEKGKKVMEYKYKAVTNWLDAGGPPQSYIAVRTPIWKRTSEYRDAISLNPYTLYRVWELNTSLKYMINHPGVGDYADMARLARLYHKHTSFILTDWKKSGLTIPHWFVKLVVKKVTELNPNYSGEFPVDGIRIFDPKTGKWFHNPDFGYGLGMVNNVYTLFNICLFEYAKRKDVFTDEDEILSFNDDSVIGCQETAYHRWTGICQDSGGYLDIHKTVQSKMVQFCEMHQGKLFLNNFKWVSAFHTLIMCMEKATNATHWRYLASEVYDSIRGMGWQVQQRIPNAHFADTIEHYVIALAQSYFGCEFENGTHPEYGGVSVGQYLRTKYNLKTTLVDLSNSIGKDFYYKASCLKVWKDSSKWQEYPEFRPWQKFPSGPTSERMKILGSVHGLNHEFESLMARTHNKFMLDTKWFQHKYWTKLEEKLSEIDYDDPHIWDIWGWISSERWPAMAIPRDIVTSSLVCNNDYDYIPFMRMEKQSNKYSLLTQVEAIHDYFKWGKPSGIKEEEISLKGFLLWEAPIFPDSDYYHPMCNMETISKIADFSDPRRAFLDYCVREKSIITGLSTRDLRAESAARFLETVQGYPENCLYKATWYTTFPMPYDPELELTLAQHLPEDHEFIIINWTFNGLAPPPEEQGAAIPFEFINRHKRENKQFWRKATRAKRASRKKKTTTPFEDRLETVIDKSLPLSELNMDNISTLMQDYRDWIDKVNAPTEEEPPAFHIVDESQFITNLEIPDWLANADSESEQSDSESQIVSDPEQDEQDLIRAALDRYGDLSDADSDSDLLWMEDHCPPGS
jgi:hypothetical protein